MAQNPFLTIAICTYHRADDLRECLSALYDQAQHHDNVALLVIDNGADSHEKQATKKAAQDFHAQYAEEPRSGLSIARNTALQLSDSPFIAYIDDDARPEPDWLEHILRTLETDRPDMMGGPIVPLWNHDPPSWIAPPLYSYFSILDHTHNNDMPIIYGANMVFKTASLSTINGFPTALGRSRGHLISCEETYVRHVFTAQNKRIVFCNHAAVKHKIPAARMRRTWVLKRAFWQGYSQVVMDVLLKSQGIKRAQNIRQKFKREPKNMMAYLTLAMLVLGSIYGKGKSLCHSGMGSLIKSLKRATSS